MAEPPTGLSWQWSEQRRSLIDYDDPWSGWSEWCEEHPSPSVRSLESDDEAIKLYNLRQERYERCVGFQYRMVRRLVGDWIPLDHELHLPLLARNEQ